MGYLHLGLSGKVTSGNGARASRTSCLELASLRLDKELCDVLTTKVCKVRSNVSDVERARLPRKPDRVKMGNASGFAAEEAADEICCVEKAAGDGLDADAVDEALKMV